MPEIAKTIPINFLLAFKPTFEEVVPIESRIPKLPEDQTHYGSYASFIRVKQIPILVRAVYDPAQDPNTDSVDGEHVPADPQVAASQFFDSVENTINQYQGSIFVSEVDRNALQDYIKISSNHAYAWFKNTFVVPAAIVYDETVEPLPGQFNWATNELREALRPLESNSHKIEWVIQVDA